MAGIIPHLIIFANKLDPDQARQNVGPDLDPNCLSLWWKSCMSVSNFDGKQADDEKS